MRVTAPNENWARNKKGTMKKAYRDFESFCGAQMLQSDMGELKVLMS